MHENTKIVPIPSAQYKGNTSLYILFYIITNIILFTFIY